VLVTHPRAPEPQDAADRAGPAVPERDQPDPDDDEQRDHQRRPHALHRALIARVLHAVLIEQRDQAAVAGHRLSGPHFRRTLRARGDRGDAGKRAGRKPDLRDFAGSDMGLKGRVRNLGGTTARRRQRHEEQQSKNRTTEK
jgi:hypothetical protein